MNGLLNLVTLVIDPGHGWNDPGATANGLQEKVLTLDISKRIAAYLKGRANVHLTRTNDTTFSKDKNSDLAARANFANKLNAAYFVSVHINAGGGTGFESFTVTDPNPKTAALRNVIHKRIAQVYAKYGLPDRGQKQANHAVTRKTNMPACLLEFNFIDNAKDAKLLKDPGFLDAIAKATAEGIADALGLPPAPTDTDDAELDKAIKKLQDVGAIDTPDYWIQNARPGKQAKGEYVALLLKRLAKKL